MLFRPKTKINYTKREEEERNVLQLVAEETKQSVLNLFRCRLTIDITAMTIFLNNANCL